MVKLFRFRKTTPRQERLHELSLFVNLTPAELEIVDGLLHERHYLEGEAAELEVRSQRDRQGDTGRVAQLGPGTFFGELALLDNSPRSAQARAASPCELIIFFRDDFVSLLETHARISSKISRQLARHLGTRMRAMALSMSAHQHLV